MNKLNMFLNGRKCPYCLGKPHNTFKEGLDCCYAQLSKSNKALEDSNFSLLVAYLDGQSLSNKRGG